MNKMILIKYGELTTKKGNRNFFIKVLYENIKNKLSDIDIVIKKDLSRMTIEYNEDNHNLVINKINQIFGIYKYHVVEKVDTNITDIEKCILNLLKEEQFNTFKVETKRSYKNFEYDSMEFNKKIGGLILKNIDNIKVDVNNPDILVNIEILKNDTYIYFKEYKGLGGYPVGTQTRALLMLSGGIDSPVAGYLALKRGIKVDCVYFEAIPHTSIAARNKVISLVEKLSLYSNNIKLHIVNFTKIQEEIYKNVDEEYVITIMRRMMYRIMTRLSKKYKALAIVNGESIGQVASQTLNSMNVINSVTNIPIIRPVACFDKLEIIDIAKKIDTYDISILPYEDCCTVFVPKHPVINPTIEKSMENEEKLSYEELIDIAVKEVNTIVINEKNLDKFSDLL